MPCLYLSHASLNKPQFPYQRPLSAGPLCPMSCALSYLCPVSDARCPVHLTLPCAPHQHDQHYNQIPGSGNR